jgi:hypothetical protein
MNKPGHALTLLILVCSVSFLLAGCTTSRHIIKAPLKEQGADYLFGQLKKSEIHFSDLSAKFSAEYTNDKKTTSFSGQIRIQHDSLIWISISPLLGIEMMRVVLTNDSVKYINRISSAFFLRDFNYMNRLLNKALDFDMVQAFLLGNDFSFYENGKFKAGVDNGLYKLSTAQRHKLKKYLRQNDSIDNIPLQHIWLDPNNFKITQVLIKEIEKDNRKFEARYSAFEEISGQQFPTNLSFAIETGESKVSIKVNYSKIVINQNQNFPFRIPGSYQPIKEIIKPK